MLEIADERFDLAGRYLADLGADVIRIVSPGWEQERVARHPRAAEVLAAVADLNRRLHVVDLSTADGGRALLDLAADADMVLRTDPPRLPTAAPDTAAPDTAAPDTASLLRRNGALVVVTITDFGLSGPYRDWIATPGVVAAMTGALSRSGRDGRDPLLPPDALVDGSVALQATWVALIALLRARRTGLGETVELSAFEAAAQCLDPGWGVGGTAAGGSAPSDGPRGRPPGGWYPVFACADGLMRTCLLTPRQWHGMRSWLGDPPELADPALDSIFVRLEHDGEIRPRIAALLATMTRAQALSLADQHGVPAAAVLGMADVLDSEHFTERGSLVRRRVGSHPGVALPAPFVEVDGVRPASGLGAVATDVSPRRVFRPRAASASGAGAGRPLAGVRVLDLGRVVAGGEAGRLLADQGADVVKVEDSTFLDGLRQVPRGRRMTDGFARGHRNERSLGLAIGTGRGAEIFTRLVASADIVISNFKPGTLDKLGLGYRQLAAVNPRVIVGDSSAFGGSGPWRGRPGYGPLIRACTGVMELWRYADGPGESGDEVSIYPDHATGRAVATAVLALLIRREQTGSGGWVSVSQSELVLNQMARELALTSADLDPRGAAETIRRLPRRYQCSGDDEWCVIDVRDDAELARLRSEIAADGFGADASPPDSHAVAKTIAAWTAMLAPSEVASRLQRLKIPAGMMLRVVDLPEDPHLRHRGFFRTQHQVECGGDMLAENAPARFGHIPEPDARRAPMLGEHTVEICEQDLGMAPAEIDRMVAAGVLEVHEAPGHGAAAPGN